MAEIFLTATVKDSERETACAILSGLCAHQPYHSIQHVLLYQGPTRPTGISVQTSITTSQPNLKLWKDLHQALSRQSYIVQARYEKWKDADFGTTRPTDFDETQGTLRWTDFPEPPQAKDRDPAITLRKKIEIWEQRKLATILNDNNYLFKNDMIEESYRFKRDGEEFASAAGRQSGPWYDIEFCLYKIHLLRDVTEYRPMQKGVGLRQAANPLPPWEELRPYGEWILTVTVDVPQDNRPGEIQKALQRAQGQLLGVKRELEGVFNFRAFDRRIHDTRVALEKLSSDGSHADGNAGLDGEWTAEAPEKLDARETAELINDLSSMDWGSIHVQIDDLPSDPVEDDCDDDKEEEPPASTQSSE